MSHEQNDPFSNLFDSNVASMTISWAKRYCATVATQKKDPNSSWKLFDETVDFNEFDEDRVRTVAYLSEALPIANEIAWNKVTILLEEELNKKNYLSSIFNPLEIKREVHHLYQKTLEAFAEYESPSRLSVLVGREITQIRRKYAETDLVIFISMAMQFHYVGRTLLDWLSIKPRTIFFRYFKAIEDYLHTPLGEVHALAANHSPNSINLIAVQQLLAQITSIAHAVYERVSYQYKGYSSQSGLIHEPMVQYSSIRDVELFQTYLCWCALESSIHPLQQQLFPICVILYPRLQVSWKLIQAMIIALFWEMNQRLSPENSTFFLPYLHTLRDLFSDEVFQEAF